MPKIRLISLLLALSVIAFAMLAVPPVAQADICSQFNGGGCFYTWNPAYGCCVPNRTFCVWFCF
jgi:hypothetical protein